MAGWRLEVVGLVLFPLLLSSIPSPVHAFGSRSRPPPQAPPNLKQYYASCSGGLTGALEKELMGKAIGAVKCEQL